MRGAPGAGKSIIISIFLRECYKHGRLRARIFFSSGAGRDLGSSNKVLTPPATQLAHKSPTLKSCICEAIPEDGYIGDSGLYGQWRKNILQLLSKLIASPFPLSLVSVTDSLDECGGEEDILLVLQLFATDKSLARLLEFLIFLDYTLRRYASLTKLSASSKDDIGIVCQLGNSLNVSISGSDSGEDIQKLVCGEAPKAARERRILRGNREALSPCLLWLSICAHPMSLEELREAIIIDKDLAERDEEKQLCEDRSNTLEVVQNPGDANCDKGQYKKAKHLYRQIFESREVSGHPETLGTFRGLAITHQQSRYKGAEQLRRRQGGRPDHASDLLHPGAATNQQADVDNQQGSPPSSPIACASGGRCGEGNSCCVACNVQMQGHQEKLPKYVPPYFLCLLPLLLSFLPTAVAPSLVSWVGFRHKP
jgi:hypothetical protein